MIVTADAKLFHGALTRAVGAVRPVKSYPILQCVRLEGGDGILRLTATDLDVDIRVQVVAAGELPPTCIDAARLAAVTAKLRDRGDLTLSVAGATAEIRAGRSRFILPTLPIDGWPSIKTADVPSTFTMSGKTLARLCTALQPAINTNASRPHLNGIFLSPGRVKDAAKKDRLLAVATDGLKAYARDFEAADVPSSMRPIIVPAFTCAAIAKLFGDDSEVTVSCGDTKIEVISGNTEYTSKLVEGTFPDWRRVFPKQEAQLAFDARQLSAAAATAIAGRTSEKSGKAVKLEFGDGETTITSADKTDGALGTDICPHNELEKLPIVEIGVNGDFLSDMIDVLDAETVEVGLIDAGSAITLRGATFDDRMICIMPMRV